jgi:hypothetical protein
MPAAFNEWDWPKNLGVANTESCENSVSLSPDEHHLFFARPRPAGPADVWVSYRSDVRDDFGWQPPVLLGAAINTDAAAESTPRLFERNRLGLWQLYFYRNPGAIGSFDTYVADAFGIAQPVTELNSPLIDAGPALARNGLEISSTRIASAHSASATCGRPYGPAFSIHGLRP